MERADHPPTAGQVPGAPTGRTAAEEYFLSARGYAALWFGFLAGPVAWAIQLAANYILVPYVCATGWAVLFHLTTLVAIGVAAAGALVSWTSWRRTGKSDQVEMGGPLGRSRFMALSGLVLAGGFGLLIVGQAVPSLIIHPCY